MKKVKNCKCGFDISTEKYSQHICGLNPETEIKNKLMVVPETTVEALTYFYENDKLEAIGVLRCRRDGKIGNHIFTNWIELPEFAEIYGGKKSKSVSDFIGNFVSGHSRTHEGKLVKITVEIYEK